VLILEAMKMETQVSAPRNGNVAEIHVRSGDSISVGDSLVSLI
jgi:oxaloacetate decarboxylase alpha subunit